MSVRPLALASVHVPTTFLAGAKEARLSEELCASTPVLACNIDRFATLRLHADAENPSEDGRRTEPRHGPLATPALTQKASLESFSLHLQRLSAQRIRDADFAVLDPLVGDQSCQLRSVLLLRVHAGEAAQPATLAHMLALSLTKEEVTHPQLGFVLGEKTQPRLLFDPANLQDKLGLATEEVPSMSKKEVKATVRAFRRDLAQSSIEFLHGQMVKLAEAHPNERRNHELAALLQASTMPSKAAVVVGEDQVPMAPFFPGVMAALHVVQSYRHPIIVEMRCFGREGQNLCLRGTALGLLQTGSQTTLNLEVANEVLRQTSAMVIGMYQAEGSGRPSVQQPREGHQGLFRHALIRERRCGSSRPSAWWTRSFVLLLCTHSLLATPVFLRVP